MEEVGGAAGSATSQSQDSDGGCRSSHVAAGRMLLAELDDGGGSDQTDESLFQVKPLRPFG